MRKDCCPIELFELIFDDDVVSAIVNNSVSYARSKGNHSFELDNEKHYEYFLHYRC